MKRILNPLTFILLLVVVVIFGFYFWASSPIYPESDYAQIKTNDYPSKKNNDSTFTIITYNIGYLSGMTNNLPVAIPKSLIDENLKTVINQFKKYNAQIIALQEIDYAANRSYDIDQENEIAKTGYNYVARAVNWDKKYLPFPEFPISTQYGRILSGQSVLSQYKIQDQKRIELVRNPNNPFYYDKFYIDRLAQIVEIKILDKKLIVINVHLEAYDQETRKKQTKKVIEIFNQYVNDYPTLLVGDFNSDIKFENASIKPLFELPRIKSAVSPNEVYPKTFSSDNPTVRLDYIFYNSNCIEFIGGKVLTEFKQASDHLPLLMKFKFKNNERFTNKTMETP